MWKIALKKFIGLNILDFYSILRKIIWNLSEKLTFKLDFTMFLVKKFENIGILDF